MHTVQLITEFSSSSFQVGLLKKSLFKLGLNQIIDITHQIRLGNITEAAFVCKQVLIESDNHFITLVLVGNSTKKIVYNFYNNWLILPDNGLLNLIFPEIDLHHLWSANQFTLEETLEIVKNNKLELLTPNPHYVIKYPKKSNNTGECLIGERIFSDELGNVYFNIQKNEVFDFLNGSSFKLKIQHVPNVFFYEIKDSVHQVDEGVAVFTFNKTGYLKLSINQGNAMKLFRLKDDTKLMIEKI